LIVSTGSPFGFTLEILCNHAAPAKGRIAKWMEETMKIKICLLMAAIAALAVVIVNGASAEEFEPANWKMGAENYSKEFEFELLGTEKWGNAEGTFSCEVHKKVTANTGGKASTTGVTHVEVTKATCVGEKGGRYEKCKVKNLANTGPLNTYTEEFHLTKTKPSGNLETVWTKDNTKFEFEGAGCGAVWSEFFFPSVPGTPNNTSAISTETVSASGEEFDSWHEGSIPSTESGSLSVKGEIEGKPASGTMGIG
jgi:hypothetical protein